MFRTIIITLPIFVEGEEKIILDYLERGYMVHIRKPNALDNQMRTLIENIPEKHYQGISLHDCINIASEYKIGGVHLNSRNLAPPNNWKGRISKSCHSLQEINDSKGQFDFVSLSPIFDSISKKGYHSRFTEEEIQNAVKRGIIDEKVYALGGVTFKKLSDVQRMGFGGAMILGDAWKDLTL